MTEDLRPPFRQQFDNARDPYTARNALGITSTGGGGSGFITAVTAPLQVTGTTLSINLSAYLTSATAAASYQPLDADLTAIAALTGTNTIYYRSAANTWTAVTIGTGLSFTGGALVNTVTSSSITTIPNAGILQYVSTTALSFKPYNGDRVKINGVLYQIPNAGIAGLGNASVFVNGVAGQNLVAATLYRVYVFNNSGTLTADFSTTAHATSTTAGNEGTEIKSGDDTRTLIGIIYTNAGTPGVFADTDGARFVRSWFNRLRQAGCVVATGSTAATFVVAVGSLNQFVCFEGEPAMGFTSGSLTVNLANNWGYQRLWLDGADASPLTSNSVYVTVNGMGAAGATSHSGKLSEGYHYYRAALMSGNASATVSLVGTVGIMVG